MSYDTDLAKEMKGRDNESYIGVIVGIVAKENPLTISIYNGAGLFTGDNLYVCKSVTEYKIPFSLNGYEGATVTGTITHEGLKQGDRVAVIATEDNQKLFVIDKLS
ncbi:DUF2577 family protein [Clostridium sp. JS66]|uniref:DUF2577 family protein n=1 Tax=Clostridium sp. JS66 TaxID=3064705 RepID=UPI00298E13E9|nr:DUF2577 family protein [Clostridium sp. JS66]WPC40618.1 DUF2577 family protein [Clostridium sp. JS66]